jgi:hypothetical protein
MIRTLTWPIWDSKLIELLLVLVGQLVTLAVLLMEEVYRD